jgi:hypothetical protein
MARLKSIVQAHFFHITWEDDCLASCFAKCKMDQMRRNSDQIWHVYVTPNNTCVCPVLALATYIFANPSLTNVENFTKADKDCNLSGCLFPVISMGGSWIASGKLLRRIRMCFLDLEFAPVIWARILRGRGRAVFLLSGCTVCPPMVSICLQAMWSMGLVKERYLQFKKAGDQYLGRVVSGLDVNNVSIAIPLPYFECVDNEGDMREKIFTLLKEFMKGGHRI